MRRHTLLYFKDTVPCERLPVIYRWEGDMFINHSMTRKVITIAKETDLLEAQAKMRKSGIRHLPVVENGNRLIGIVSDRDIRRALPDGPMEYFNYRKEKDRLSKLKINDIMTRDTVTISPLNTIGDALLLFQKKRVGALPVVDDEKTLVGILSVRDLLQAFVRVLGIDEPGILMGILMEKKTGQFKKIVDAITEENVSFGSILVARHGLTDKQVMFPYLLTKSLAPVKRKLKKMGYTLVDPMDWHLSEPPESA